jgi:hypothetical protein
MLELLEDSNPQEEMDTARPFSMLESPCGMLEKLPGRANIQQPKPAFEAD